MNSQLDAGILPDASALLCWHLVMTKPLCEDLAKVNLERQGYRVYFPRALQRVFYRGRWRDRICALFPRYLFVQLNKVRQSLAPLRSTLGVSSVVRFGDEYSRVPNPIVDSLIGREDSFGFHHLTHSQLKPGTSVRVVEGALSGLEGIFESEDANDRVVILLSLLGRETTIKVPASIVAPAA